MQIFKCKMLVYSKGMQLFVALQLYYGNQESEFKFLNTHTHISTLYVSCYRIYMYAKFLSVQTY